MISKKLYITIIIYVSLIVLLSVLFGFLVAGNKPIRYLILCAFGIVLLAIGLISFLNRTNRNIRFFFDSVKNEDSSLTFATSDAGAGLKELYESMNRVNRQIQQLRIRNRQQEQYFQKILEQLATGIVTYDRKGFIHHANTAAKNLLSVDSFTHIRQLDRIDPKLFSVLKSLRAFERRLVGINFGEGERQLSLKTTSFGRDEAELIILSVQDIKHELDEKEVESWMKLIRVLMHEIMNSITPITSLSDSLASIFKSGGDPVLPEAIDEKKIAATLQGLRVISEQGKGLMSFVDSYRKLTRIPRPELKPVKVEDLFSRVKILSDSLENPGRVNMNYENGNGLEILADENLVSLVLINLIKNALEANVANDNGIIRITSGTDKDNRPEICVRDNGPGISEENLGKIFIPFFTTRPNGSGIGLSLSRQIMGAHGGSLKVHSIPGRETVFCMTFRS